MESQQHTADPVVDSGVPSSSKPLPASAILTFIPDNEVKKIVTMPQVENNNSLDVDKQMVLRERRTTGQESPFTRKRPTLSSFETEGEAKSIVPTGVCPEESMSASSSDDIDTDLVEEMELVKQSSIMMSVGEEKGSLKVSASGESLKETKEPIAPESTVKKEENKSSGLSENSMLSERTSGDKMEEEKCLLKNPISESDVKPKFSKSQKEIISQTKTVGKSETSSSSAANDSKTLSVSRKSVEKGTKPATVSSVTHPTKSSTADDAVTAVQQTKPEPVFRLGSEANYSSYVNQFTSNPLALTKQQQLEQRDKKRSVTNKFSLVDYKWHGDVSGSKDVILNTLRFSIVGLENSIASTFMHPSWPVQRSTWVRAVHLSKTPKEFAAALSFLESSIRPICYLPVWNDAVGHVELHRMVSEAKQAGTKKKDHKEEEEEPELEHKGFGECMLFCLFVLLV